VQGRRIPDPGFAGDDGAADPRLTSAQRAHADDPARLPEVIAVLHRVRVLAPVVAVLGETGTGEAGLTVDKSADIAVPLLLDPDGHRALPVFSGLDELARWDRSARPVPVDGPRAAAVAVSERAEAVVLDIAGPMPVTLGRPEVRALAEGRGTVPAYADDELAREVARVLAEEPAVARCWLAPGVGVDALVTVAVDERARPAEVGGRLATQLRDLAGRGVRGLDIALQAAAAPAPPGRLVYAASRSTPPGPP
jgi:hypothetical protein